MIWIAIMAGLIAGLLLSLWYLSSRFAKFEIIKKLARNKKRKGRIWGIACVLILGGSLYTIMGFMNAVLSLLHLAVFWLLFDGIEALIKKKYKLACKCYWNGILAILVTMVYLSVGWYLAFHVSRTEYRISTDKAVGSFRIALISDSHIGNTFHWQGFEKHLKTIEKEQPDILVITGDFVDDYVNRTDMVECCRALGEIKTRYGVYYVFGNHDKGYYGADYRGFSGEELQNELEKNGVIVLEDEMSIIDQRIQLIGRQDASEDVRGGKRATMQELEEKIDATKYSVVLDHQPTDYENQEGMVDMVLSGHTHGGQMLPVLHVGEWTGVNDKVYGWEERNGTNFIVSSGISDWEIKFKTGCKSEYVVVDIEGK